VVKGIRVYFPNLIFSMIPNFTAPIKDNTPISKVGNRHIKRTKDPNVRRPTKKGGPGKIIGYEPYNPFIATFKVSKQLNKHDIKSYLKAVYNLDTTFVRTIVYNAPKRRLTRDKGSTFEWGVGDSKRSFKKAVVGLAEPFYYPFDRQNMNDIDLARFENDLHAKFNVPRGGNVKQEKIRKEENDALHPRTNRYNRLPYVVPLSYLGPVLSPIMC
jgi:ribosomal protein L23